jgi:hypothetical protein
MPDGPTIHSRRVTRQMDHFILALRADPAAQQPSFLLSLYWIAYEDAGVAGHLAYLRADPAEGLPRTELVLTDAPALEAALRPSTRPAQWPLQDPERPARVATFARRPLSPSGFAWTIRAAGLGDQPAVEIEARWEEIAAPVFATGPARGGNWIASTLLEARRAGARIDGAAVPGAPFPNPIWQPWLGRADTGSCVIGLGEVIYERL